jgi:diguanylate cyclase (GGDEF)-like protein
MRNLSSRVTSGVVYACAVFALAVVIVGALGMWGVQSATNVGRDLNSDELRSAVVTSRLGLQLDAVYANGQRLAAQGLPSRRGRLAAALYDNQIPAVEAQLASLKRIHEGDNAAEKADIAKLVGRWATLRGVLNPSGSTLRGLRDSGLDTRLTAAYQPLRDHIDLLIAREETDARDDQAGADSNSRRALRSIAAAVAVAVLGSIGLGWIGGRQLRRAVEPAQDQVEFADRLQLAQIVFADNLQLAQNEDEAQHLLQRHLEHLISDSAVTVFNRNNSADRLEAVTDLPTDSPLIETLPHAEPHSCFAVRSGRSHDEDEERPALLGCPVCSQCPGRSTCTPLTVGGEVIGSVLVNREATYSALERQGVRDSVGQAAPVLANLRNLAIAELRAATDALTGLPNKRAVGDTLKRMLAQASRTLTPLSLIVLDLDHFKDINDRFGHPVGDQALAGVGAALRSALRDSDFAGRNGGEEFAVMLPATDSAGAILVAEKVRDAIAEIDLPGVGVRMTASVGIASYPEHATSPERLERLADAALYTAKRVGRDHVEVAVPSADPTATELSQVRPEPATTGSEDV